MTGWSTSRWLPGYQLSGATVMATRFRSAKPRRGLWSLSALGDGCRALALPSATISAAVTDLSQSASEATDCHIYKQMDKAI
jgi:hypothetical protein